MNRSVTASTQSIACATSGYCFLRPAESDCGKPATPAATHINASALAGRVCHRYHVMLSSAKANMSSGNIERQVAADTVAIRQNRIVCSSISISPERRSGRPKNMVRPRVASGARLGQALLSGLLANSAADSSATRGQQKPDRHWRYAVDPRF